MNKFAWGDLPPLFKKAQSLLRQVGSVLDVGAGIRPQPLLTAEKMLYVEPHEEYANVLRDRGLTVYRGAAPNVLKYLPRVDTVILLDVIEHLEKEQGLETVELALELAREQVVIFTPLGFMPQSGGAEKDPWGYQGQKWQKHRSGWEPKDFEGWQILSDPKFHASRNAGAFFAIHG